MTVRRGHVAHGRTVGEGVHASVRALNGTGRVAADRVIGTSVMGRLSRFNRYWP